MHEWSNVIFKDIVSFNPLESIKKGDVAVKIGMDKLQPFCRDISEVEYEEFSGGTKFRNGDTIMARITPCLENGKTAMVNVLEEDQVGFGSTEYIVFRAKKGMLDPNFLYYLVCSPTIREPAIKSMVGSSGRQRVQTSVVQNLEFLLPSLPEQEKIGALLKKLDDKVSINNKINRNLEVQARLLFYELFIRRNDKYSYETSFEFGDVRSDFSIIKIGDIPMLVTDYVANGSFASLKENVTLHQEPEYAYFIRNTDLKTGAFGVYVDKHSYEFLSKSELHGGEIIISNVGDVGSVYLCPVLDKPMTLGNNIIMLRPKDERIQYYLYVWFKWSYGRGLIKGITGGSAQPKFNKTDFKNTPVIIPDKELLKNFDEIVGPMFETIASNDREILRLRGTKDALLPKLMSGELDISNLDI